jgi:hypothetical protein
VIGLGGGLRVPLRSRAAWTLDASLAWHHLLSLETRKDDPTAPGGDFRIDGEVIAASLMTGVEL